MRSIPKPNIGILDTFDVCISGTSDDSLHTRLCAIRQEILDAGNNYDQLAQGNNLHLVPPNNKKNHEIVLGAVQKDELKSVYTKMMVVETKPGRKYYDMLKESAPRGICPFCGFSPVGTLDHYLPKAKYPNFSVLAYNLIPACSDCNKGKLAQKANSPDQQTIHPYYDGDKFIKDQWLFAEVMETTPVTIKFFVRAPDHWGEIEKKRVSSHFDCFELAAKFSIVSSNEVTSLKWRLSNYYQNRTERQKHLFEMADSHFSSHKNSWEAAMYQALANSEWYCDGGYEKY